MKLSLFNALLFLSFLGFAAVTYAADEEEEVDLCTSQTEALDANEDIIAEKEALANTTANFILPPSQGGEILLDGDISDEIDMYTPDCVGVDENTTLFCKFNYLDYIDNLESACMDANGTFFLGGARLVCQTRDLRSELHYLNAPICVSRECDDPRTMFHDMWEEIAEDDLSEADGLNCLAFFENVDRPFPGSGAAGGFVWNAALSLVVAVAGTFVAGL